MKIHFMRDMMNFWIFGWASIGILYVSNDLVELCFGKNYVLGIEIPFVIALNFYTVGMQNAVWTFKQTLGLFKYGKFLQIFTALINILFSVLLGYRFGLVGILFATFIARLFTNLWYDPYVVFKYGFYKKPLEYLYSYFKYLVILILIVIICGISCNMINGGIVYRVIVKCLICSFLPNFICILMFYRRKEFRYLTDLIKRIFCIVCKNKFNKDRLEAEI